MAKITEPKTIVLMWGTFGPYHIARLRATAALLNTRGWKLVGLEITRTSGTYDWAFAPGGADFERVTLLPDAETMVAEPDRVRTDVTAALERADADAVAIPGWHAPAYHAAIRWCRLNGRAAILMSTSKADDFPRNALKEWVKGRIVRNFDSALVAGTPQKNYTARLGLPEAKIFFGYAAIDNDYFIEQARTIREDEAEHLARFGLTKPFFVSVNRMVGLKNLDRLLTAYAAYRKTVGPEGWKLVLVGSGPEEAKLKARVENEKIDGVVFPGFKQIDQLPPYYALAECLVHPSLKETWGLVLNEAMACDLPILVSKTIGARYELLREGENGWMFDPESADQITEALLRMTHLPETERRAMSQASRRIIDRWGPSAFAGGVLRAVDAGLVRAAARGKGMSILSRLLIR